MGKFLISHSTLTVDTPDSNASLLSQIAGLQCENAKLEHENQTLRHAREALIQNEARLQRVLDGSDQGFWDWDLKQQQFFVSERFESMLGFAVGERDLSPEYWLNYVHPDDLPHAMYSIEQHMLGQTPCHEVELRCLTKSGRWKWILTRGRIVRRDTDGTPLLMSGTHTDIDQRKQEEKLLRDQSALLDLAHDAIIVRDRDDAIVYWNRGAELTYGWSAGEASGKVTHQLLKTEFPEPLQQIREQLYKYGRWEGELEHIVKGGERIVVASRWVLKHDDVDGFVTVMEINRDITEKRTLQLELEKQAHQDSLTGLHNRGYFIELAEMELKKSTRYGDQFVMFMIDIDHFKRINDSFGHQTGDIVLKQLAAIFLSTLREVDIIGRVGGEEFAVLLPETPLAEAAAVADRLRLAVMNAHIALADSPPIHFTVSIGVAAPSSNEFSLHALLGRADSALYQAKQSGRNKVVVFELP